MNTTYKEIQNGYRVGSDGTVWSRWTSKDAAGRGHCLGTKWIELKGGLDKDGYRKVILCNGNGARRYVRVQTLVLEAFVGPKPSGMVSAHRNGIRADNRIENLRWATQKENCADKITCGTAQRGETHPLSKVTEAQVRTIRTRRAAGESLSVLAAEYGVQKAAICAIATRRTWKHV